MDIPAALQHIVDGQDLSQEQATQVFHTIMSGAATPAQIGALLAALRVKGETAEEIAGAAMTMRELSTKVLECILVGTPAIITRSPLHISLFEEEWPFFVISPEDLTWQENIGKKIQIAKTKIPGLLEKLDNHSISTISNRFKALLEID